jgi:hypothetical protein
MTLGIFSRPAEMTIAGVLTINKQLIVHISLIYTCCVWFWNVTSLKDDKNSSHNIYNQTQLNVSFN